MSPEMILLERIISGLMKLMRCAKTNLDIYINKKIKIK